MNYIQRLENWGAAHHPRYMDFVRIAFGLFLIVKGVEFAQNSSSLSAVMERQLPFSGLLLLLLSHYIIFAHTVGGFLIAVGLLTRLSCILQIPILIGALIFVNWDVMGHFSGFLLALLTLALLVWFYIIGSGPFSLDAEVDRQPG